MSQQMNLIHASDAVESAKKEKAIVFEENEVFDYEKDVEVYIYSEEERA